MEKELRIIIVTEKYVETVAFYLDGLVLPIIEAWNRGPSDQGTLFEASSSGTIEIIATPLSSDSTADLLTPGSPQGFTVGIEVEEKKDLDPLYRQVKAGGLPIKRELGKLPWGHRGFSVTDPNGISVYIYSKN